MSSLSFLCQGPTSPASSSKTEIPPDEICRGKKLKRIHPLLLPLFIFIVLLSLNQILPEKLEQAFIFESRFLIFLLNAVFVSLSSFVIAYLAGEAYIHSGSLSLFLLGAGGLTIGLANAVASLLLAPGGTNLVLKIHNCGVLLAGALHFTGTVFAQSESRFARESSRRLFLLLAYAAVISLFLLFSLSLHRFIPDFFRPEAGFTSLRQMVLGLAVVLFAVSGLNFRSEYHTS